MGGEKYPALPVRLGFRGSPPRGRGKVFRNLGLTVANRITPAWAGKSAGFQSAPSGPRDHPRVGGEKHSGSCRTLTRSGSPPRGRGKAEQNFVGQLQAGITPAWAGKRYVYNTVDKFWEDHPRVGGEKSVSVPTAAAVVGSPPRGRGKDEGKTEIARTLRITPAWAGKRLKRSHRSGIFISGPIPFHSVLHRPAGSGGSRAGRDGSPAGQPQNAGPA